MKEPRLRFKEFRDEWHAKELDILTEINTGKSITKAISKYKDDKHVYPVMGSTGVIGYSDHYDYAGNFILIARVGSNSGYVYSYNGKISITDNTIFLQYDSTDFLKGLLSHADISKMSYGLSSRKIVKASELGKINIYLPSLSEQQKIGSFFANLDNQIELQSDKLKVLKRDKKGYLQKMFPSDGSNRPRLRFKGFNDDWETKELGSIYDLKTGKSTYEKHEKNLYNYPILGSTGFLGYDGTSDYDGNFLLIARVGEAGNLYRYKGKAKITDNTMYINTKDADFLFYLLNTVNFDKLVFGSTRKLIKSSDVKRLKIKVPSRKESEMIKIFFINLDQQIDLQQQKVTDLKNQKKAYLQKMFI